MVLRLGRSFELGLGLVLVYLYLLSGQAPTLTRKVFSPWQDEAGTCCYTGHFTAAIAA